MNNKLQVVFSKLRDHKVLATVSGLPGDDAELTPGQLKSLASTLLRIYGDTFFHHADSKNPLTRAVEYDIKD